MKVSLLKNIADILKSSMLSGVCVGIAGFGYLATRDIVGSILFAFGLLAVINYRLRLYTGFAGFIKLACIIFFAGFHILCKNENVFCSYKCFRIHFFG